MADEVWLPENPPPNQNVGSGKRTFLIWLILVVIFVGIYTAIGDDDPRAAEIASGYRGYWIWLAALAGFFTPIVFLVWQFRGAAKFNVAQTAGLEALAQNKPQLAADLFAELARKTRTRPQHHAIASYNHGISLTRAGESARAVGVLLRVERTPKLQLGGIKTLTPIALARAFSIGGDVAKANAWLETAKKRPALDNPVYGRALLVSAEILVRCREGRFDEALAVCEANWHVLENQLPIDAMAEPCLLRAFAITMKSTVRDAAAAEPWLRMLRILPPDRSRWLTHHWPELEHFATTNDVLRAAPSIPSSTVAPA